MSEEEEELPASPAPIGWGRVETPPPDEPAGRTQQDEADGQNKVGTTRDEQQISLFRPGNDIVLLPACTDFCLLVYFVYFCSSIESELARS